MKKQVKAQGLSLNTIVIAAIVLVVLLVVLVIFKGGIGKIWPSISGANDCKDDLGRTDDGCQAAGKCTAGTEVYGLGCEKKDDGKTPYCCVLKKENA